MVNRMINIKIYLSLVLLCFSLSVSASTMGEGVISIMGGPILFGLLVLFLIPISVFITWLYIKYQKKDDRKIAEGNTQNINEDT